MSTQHDTPARITGLLVFLAGIGLLVFVFLAARSLFDAPAPVPAAAPAGGDNASALAEVGRSFGQLGRQLLLLLLMCIAGSVIASKGIQLYFAARPMHTPPAPNGPAPAAEPLPHPAPAPRPAAPEAAAPSPPAAEPKPVPGATKEAKAP